jgi:hypothetical protein
MRHLASLPFTRRGFLTSLAASGAMAVTARNAAAEKRASGAGEVRTSNHLDADLHLFLNRDELAVVDDVAIQINRPKKNLHCFTSPDSQPADRGIATTSVAGARPDFFNSHRLRTQPGFS